MLACAAPAKAPVAPAATARPATNEASTVLLSRSIADSARIVEVWHHGRRVHGRVEEFDPR
ncbi:MAG TPA: hypothetical protein VGI70_05425 [Polyangiales bacterium]